MAERPLWPRRNWWLALLAILVLAGALRYPGYAFSLPYVDYIDEPNHNLAARMLVDFGTARSIGHDSYPPGVIMLNYVFIRLFHDPATPPSTVTGLVRLVAITASMGVVILLALLGYHSLGPPAGLLSAGIWTITPSFVYFSRLAIPDIFVTFFTVSAIWLVLAGTRFRRSGWTTYATYMLMLAIVFKYQAIFMTPVILLAPLWNGRSYRRRVIDNMARFALFSAWLLFLTPVLLPPDPNIPINNWRQHTDVEGIPSPSLLLHNLRVILAEIDTRVSFSGSLGILLLPGLIGWAFLAWDRGIEREQRFAIATIILSAAAWLVGLSLFGTADFRQMVALATIVTLMAGIGYMGLWHILRTLPKRYPALRTRWLAVAALALLFASNLPNLRASIANAHEATLPDQRNDLAQYMDTTLTSGIHIATYDNHKTLNSHWGGYAGLTPFPHLLPNGVPGPISQESVDHWRALDVLYAIMPHYEYQSLLADDPAGYLAETTLLKSYPPSAAHRGPAMVVLRLHPMQHQTTGQLGPIRLLGYDLASGDIRAGETLPFHLYWQSRAPTDDEYIVFNHLLNSAGGLVAQIDGPPLPDPLLRRTTADWDDPEEIIFSREFNLQLPETLAPGEYTLVTGFYRRQDGVRLRSPVGEDSLFVSALQIASAE